MAERVVDGVDDAHRRIARVILNLRSHQVGAAASVAILPMQNHAKIHAPVKSGNLSRSITHQRQRLRPNLDQMLVGTNVEYAPWQEFGTRHHQAHPFLRPAYDTRRRGFEKDYARALGAIVIKGL